MDKLKELCRKIGYVFQDEKLLRLALTHRSMGHQNNERLEFLGDSILNFIVGEALFKKQIDATEGELSRLRATLVKGETLDQIAKEFNLGDYLILGPGELKSGGHKRSSILAGAVEAIIGALFLDSGFMRCQQVVSHWYSERILQLASAEECKDPKTLLQEYLQSKHYEIPKYTLVETKGQAHNQTFVVQCAVPELKLKLTAKGASRRKAEQAAAEKILEDIHDRH